VLITHHAIQAPTAVEIQIYSFLTPTLHLLDFHAKTTKDSFYTLIMCGTMYMVIVMIMGYSCKNIATSKKSVTSAKLPHSNKHWDWAHHNGQEDGIKIQLISGFSNSFGSDHYITLKVTDFVEVNKQNKSLMQKYLNSRIYTHWSLTNGTKIKFQPYLKLWKIKL
jgi:hypothetical protein